MQSGSNGFAEFIELYVYLQLSIAGHILNKETHIE